MKDALKGLEFILVTEDFPLAQEVFVLCYVSVSTALSNSASEIVWTVFTFCSPVSLDQYIS